AVAIWTLLQNKPMAELQKQTPDPKPVTQS
ncbi:hypothetical protein, partial [Atlantibacter hermannii]